MDTQANNQPIKEEIQFANGNHAVAVKVDPTADPVDILAALEIGRPASVVLLIGGADELNPNLNPQIELLLRDGLLAAAAESDALILDGGTEAGLMALVGRVVAQSRRVTTLVGVAPAGKVTYPGAAEAGSPGALAQLDPNHSHFVLVDGAEWSTGTDMMFKLAGELSQTARVVVLLINGGKETLDEVSRSVGQRWPVIVINGSGRLADEIAAHASLTANGDFEILHLTDAPFAVRDAILRNTRGPIYEAWARFAQYDAKAIFLQERYRQLLFLTLVIGVLGTLFALAQQQFANSANYSELEITRLSLAFIALPLLVVTVFTLV